MQRPSHCALSTMAALWGYQDALVGILCRDQIDLRYYMVPQARHPLLLSPLKFSSLQAIVQLWIAQGPIRTCLFQPLSGWSLSSRGSQGDWDVGFEAAIATTSCFHLAPPWYTCSDMCCVTHNSSIPTRGSQDGHLVTSSASHPASLSSTSTLASPWLPWPFIAARST